jgi:hypothetical protein
MVVTEVQPVIASGQVRPTDTLVDVQQHAKPGTITVLMEPLYEGQLDSLPLGGNCIANLYTSNQEALQDPDIGTLHSLGLHAIDTVGLVHALILRLQAIPPADPDPGPGRALSGLGGAGGGARRRGPWP